MPRAEKQVPTVYFGKPGALFSLPWPVGDISKDYERQTYDFLTGSGNHQVSQLTAGSRLYGLKWAALHYDSYLKLEQFYTGANGSGPFVLLDPSVANLLPANASAGTGLYRNSTHFVTPTQPGGGQLTSNSDATFIHRTGGAASLKWTWGSAADSAPTLGITPLYRSWWGTPAIPNQPYIFSAWVRPDGVIDSSIQVSVRLRWLDSVGATISEVTSGNLTVTGWQRLSVSGTAPSNAFYVYPVWVAVGTSITTGGSLYIDEPLLEYGTTLNDWAPGTGVKPVQFMSLTDNAPFSALMRKDVQLQLRELSR